MKPLSLKSLPVEPLLRRTLALLASLRLPAPRWLRAVGWRMIAAGVLLGGIVHICATLAAPALSSGHAYLRLRETLPANRMVVLPPQAPDRQLLPYLPPHTFYALCRYDLSAGPVLVTATVSGAGWALSLHSPQGDNFYVLPGQPQRRAEVSLLVMGSGQDAAPKRDSPTDTRIVSPTTAGLIVVRAPLRGLAWAAQTEETLRRAACTQLKP